jgi:hypothetical protein
MSEICDEAYGLGVVWLEARVSPREGDGTRHRIVTYETASRAGEPFEAVIEKYGLPGPGFLHCTRELKANPIRSYLRSIGWESGTYDTAIGIRADEIDRAQPDAAKRSFTYPLIRLGITKPAVIKHFNGSNIDLSIPEHLGNCTWCWKKSEAKHVKLALENPEVFDFPRRMEALHANTGAGDQRRFMFRKRRTVADIFALAAERGTDPDEPYDRCDESCEIDAEDAA